jgi:hypothetical protein
MLAPSDRINATSLEKQRGLGEQGGVAHIAHLPLHYRGRVATRVGG